MFFCVLCAKDFKGNNKGIGLDRKINELINFEEAIKQQIPNYETLLSPSSKVTCATCFNCFKLFYELVINVHKRLNNLINEKHVKSSQIRRVEEQKNHDEFYNEKNFIKMVQLEFIGKENNQKVESFYKGTNESENDSDFEWEMDEDDFKITKNDFDNKKSETKINSQSFSLSHSRNLEEKSENEFLEDLKNHLDAQSFLFVENIARESKNDENIKEDSMIKKSNFVLEDGKVNHEKGLKLKSRNEEILNQEKHDERYLKIKSKNEEKKEFSSQINQDQSKTISQTHQIFIAESNLNTFDCTKTFEIIFKAPNFVIEPINIEYNPSDGHGENFEVPSSSRILLNTENEKEINKKLIDKNKIADESIKMHFSSSEISKDGVEYKIPLKKFKQRFTSPKIRGNDPNRRKHPSLDPENERKIREFIEVKCHICSLDFESFSKVKKHFKRFHKDQEAFLICCGKKFTKRSHLLDHIEWHDKSKTHRCEICNKDYKNKTCLRTHNKMCHSENCQECICSICGKVCKNEVTLRNHMKCHEIDTTRSFECYGCKKQFPNFHVLRNHLYKAHGGPAKDRDIICHICSAQVKSKHYKQHMKIHLDREKIKCDVCNRWLLKESMIIHMKKHNDMGTTCTICGKFLKYSAYLPTHMKLTHSEDYKFKCKFCEKPFHKRTKMMEHIAAKHTREILFRCRVEGCGREFRAEGNWKVHEKKNHPDEYEKFFKPNYLRNPESE